MGPLRPTLSRMELLHAMGEGISNWTHFGVNLDVFDMKLDRFLTLVESFWYMTIKNLFTGVKVLSLKMTIFMSHRPLKNAIGI